MSNGGNPKELGEQIDFYRQEIDSLTGRELTTKSAYYAGDQQVALELSLWYMIQLDTLVLREDSEESRSELLRTSACNYFSGLALQKGHFVAWRVEGNSSNYCLDLPSDADLLTAIGMGLSHMRERQERLQSKIAH